MNLQLPTADLDLFYGTAGSRTPEIIVVGEAWGAEEDTCSQPFVGQSGKELFRMLGEAFGFHPQLLADALQERSFAQWLTKRQRWLEASKILLCNVVAKRPPENDFTHFLFSSKEKPDVSYIFRGVACKPELLRGLDRLRNLLNHCNPKLVVACGNWPLWALRSDGDLAAADVSTTVGFKTPKGIAKWRGSQLWTVPAQRARYPLLPILHPAAILREWGWRNITVHDLRSRAARYLRGELTWEPPTRTFTFAEPTFRQIIARLDHWIRRADSSNLGPNDGGALRLAVDLETYRRSYISVIGLADADLELCIGLFTARGGTLTNRFTRREEIAIFEKLKLLLEHPNVRILGQNFIYDTEWLHRYYNIKAIVSFDTMVAHHLLFPGTPKRLDYLASLYCDHYVYWKDESWDLDGDIGLQTWNYNCKDLRATYEIATLLRKVIANQGLDELYAFQMEQWRLSRDLMLGGIAFDTTLQKEMRLQLLEEANHLSEWLLDAVPSSWRYTSTGKPWYDSPKGTADLLYGCMGLSPVLHKKTKKPTTDDSALAEISERPAAAWLKPLLDRLRHLRSLGVFTSNFLEARPSPDGRMRSSFNIAHPETFRWSSNRNGFGEGLNGQNLPKGDPESQAQTAFEAESFDSEPADPAEAA